VVVSANLAPLHSLKNNAAAYLISIYARWIPRQVNAPAPKAQKAVLAAGDIDFSFSLNQREGSKLWKTVSLYVLQGRRKTYA
jgi:hypothetical protein